MFSHLINYVKKNWNYTPLYKSILQAKEKYGGNIVEGDGLQGGGTVIINPGMNVFCSRDHHVLVCCAILNNNKNA